MKKIGLKEVAEAAGVSVATVSYAVSGGGSVSEKTRAHVLRTADLLGFIRDESAARLRSGQSRLIGVILNNIVNPFFSELVAELETTAYHEGYLTVLATAQNDLERQQKLIQSMVSQGVGAIILSPVHGTTSVDLAAAEQRNIPVVVCVRDVPESAATFVGVDDQKSGYLAAQALLAAGHQRADFIGGYDRTTTWAGRKRGIEAAFEDAGLSPEHCRFRPGTMSPAVVSEEVSRLMTKGELSDAIICFNDNLATGVYSAAQSLGRLVGRDLSVVGFDNVPLGRALSPGLTTVDIFPGKLGSISADTAVRLVRGKARDEGRENRPEPTLMMRGSIHSP
ncbi:LacI family transcriptional regulator [Defluviimonas sp. WL0002]|uniref:LacI family transcriptional regulator n=1 Tax=Albidovulum marisflavi TaxID=2984159 RepID=A0ABT2ZGR1_9RHOB|nr:LacI family DNA-binding transcriptional regulator [Defluviimonas sp. WL0002]MCV2870329.1 LacI family transcriptional regulator [Defluviimonas sp. WL0002]